MARLEASKPISFSLANTKRKNTSTYQEGIMDDIYSNCKKWIKSFFIRSHLHKKNFFDFISELNPHKLKRQCIN
jgi:hypothetical protein